MKIACSQPMPQFATLYLGNDAPLPLDFLQRMAPFALATTPI
jgi:hypothetical protein